MPFPGLEVGGGAGRVFIRAVGAPRTLPGQVPTRNGTGGRVMPFA